MNVLFSKRIKIGFKQWYDSTLPLDRFSFEDSVHLQVEARVQKKDCFVKFHESFQDENGMLKYILDYDGYKFKVKSTDYLTVTDNLHEMISQEFEKSNKRAVISIYAR